MKRNQKQNQIYSLNDSTFHEYLTFVCQHTKDVRQNIVILAEVPLLFLSGFDAPGPSAAALEITIMKQTLPVSLGKLGTSAEKSILTVLYDE